MTMQRFMSKVCVCGPDECWEWQAARDIDGYGRFSYLGDNVPAQRVSYILHKGEIPPGMLVCHECDNPSCVNPKHLFLGTQHDNVIDMFAKNRQPQRNLLRGSAKGTNKLVEEDIYKIRELIEQGYTNQQIADMFNVAKATISHIKTKRNWGHI